eukprot:gene11175-18788_t
MARLEALLVNFQEVYKQRDDANLAWLSFRILNSSLQAALKVTVRTASVSKVGPAGSAQGRDASPKRSRPVVPSLNWRAGSVPPPGSAAAMQARHLTDDSLQVMKPARKGIPSRTQSLSPERTRISTRLIASVGGSTQAPGFHGFDPLSMGSSASVPQLSTAQGFPPPPSQGTEPLQTMGWTGEASLEQMWGLSGTIAEEDDDPTRASVARNVGALLNGG